MSEKKRKKISGSKGKRPRIDHLPGFSEDLREELIRIDRRLPITSQEDMPMPEVDDPKSEE